VGIAEHATIGDGAAIGAQSGITGEIKPGDIVQGTPAVPHTTFKRMHFYNLRLGELFQQVRQLKRRLEQLEGRENGA
jgi:UDP-3-O-[3-hydroxymyristoyl] glucosamine N-acyltransferase